MALLNDESSHLPSMLKTAVDGNLAQVLIFMQHFIQEVLDEIHHNTRILWEMPTRTSARRGSRHFKIIRGDTVICYGAVSTQQKIEQMKEYESRRLYREILRPARRDHGYILLTEKTDRGLKVEFAVVHWDAGNLQPHLVPILATRELGTMELVPNQPSEGLEAAFSGFLGHCVQFVHLPDIRSRYMDSLKRETRFLAQSDTLQIEQDTHNNA
ncbi:hypothetical protein PRK78_006966 [Emydomyces testavorans]|uniref:Uncharacterized protein n=1 Tax=Emydomyces testavorans TaxID=2070801 RepID=A0AAF0DQC3_9EURO|nr:hypothetical protein PRK78_006966 [Emydomyces testavorans]